MRSDFVTRIHYGSDQAGVPFRKAAENEKGPPHFAIVEQLEQFHRVFLDMRRIPFPFHMVDDPREYFRMIIFLNINREIDGLISLLTFRRG
jgi:hypothetical protein